jgi:hypothetical protein
MSTKDKQEQLVKILKSWQHIENQSIQQTAKIIDKSKNPLIRLVMEIIQRDSTMHHRVEQFIIDSIENENRPVTLTVEDLEQVWGAIESHIEAEAKTGELVSQAMKALSGTKNVAQQYLLTYLENDEKKHDEMLDALALVKRGMYKSA